MAGIGQGEEGMAAAPTPVAGVATPGQAPGLAAAGPGGGGGGTMVVQVINPAPPTVYVDPDGSLVYVSVPPVAPNQAARATAGASAFDQYFWPVLALLGLLGIFVSVVWAFSKRRAARRYIDLKVRGRSRLLQSPVRHKEQH